MAELKPTDQENSPKHESIIHFTSATIVVIVCTNEIEETKKKIKLNLNKRTVFLRY